MHRTTVSTVLSVLEISDVIFFRMLLMLLVLLDCISPFIEEMHCFLMPYSRFHSYFKMSTAPQKESISWMFVARRTFGNEINNNAMPVFNLN